MTGSTAVGSAGAGVGVALLAAAGVVGVRAASLPSVADGAGAGGPGVVATGLGAGGVGVPFGAATGAPGAAALPGADASTGALGAESATATVGSAAGVGGLLERVANQPTPKTTTAAAPAMRAHGRLACGAAGTGAVAAGRAAADNTCAGADAPDVAAAGAIPDVDHFVPLGAAGAAAEREPLFRMSRSRFNASNSDRSSAAV